MKKETPLLITPDMMYGGVCSIPREYVQRAPKKLALSDRTVQLLLDLPPMRKKSESSREIKSWEQFRKGWVR